MARKKIVQSLTFDPKLDAALHYMHEVAKSKVKGLTYNGYVEGILSAYLTKRFGKVPTVEELEQLRKKNQ